MAEPEERIGGVEGRVLPGLGTIGVSTAIAGFALGMYYAVDLALVMRTLPEERKGEYLGIFNLATTIPQSVAPAVAPLALMIGGPGQVTGNDSDYASLSLVGTIAVLASLAVLPALRPILRRTPEPTGTSAQGPSPDPDTDPIPETVPETAPASTPGTTTASGTTPNTKDVTP